MDGSFVGGRGIDDFEPVRADFIEAAEAYLNRIAALDEHTELDVREMHGTLADLQAGAARLSGSVQLGEAGHRSTYAAIEKLSYDELRRRLRRLPLDSYFVTFDPFDAASPPVLATIADDLADIYDDLVTGFEKRASDGLVRAIDTWELLYYSHWGRHAVHAQTALWQYLANRELD
ncbi:MAG TPA: DUF5063 domain-containing protein [Candidatus Cybelea sp.]|nr:DUF5063 domain-containing protein [Candidatus Cybelea sp.]